MSSPTTKRVGHCLCGAVKISAPSASNDVHACHCSMCRRWTGTANMVLHCGTDVTFEGKEHVSVYDSSEWAQRGFCSRCGTGLFYHLKGTGDYMMMVGLFEPDASLTFTEEIFIDEKPDYFSFADDTKKLTGAEVFARHGVSE